MIFFFFFVKKKTITLYVINEIQQLRKFQNIAQCPLNIYLLITDTDDAPDARIALSSGIRDISSGMKVDHGKPEHRERVEEAQSYQAEPYTLDRGASRDASSRICIIL